MFWLLFYLCFTKSCIGNEAENKTADKFIVPALQVMTYVSDPKWNTTLKELPEFKEVVNLLFAEAIVADADKYYFYSDRIQEFLEKHSDGLARDQLHTILSNILKNDELVFPGSGEKVQKLINLLEDNESQVYKDLDGILALPYV